MERVLACIDHSPVTSLVVRQADDLARRLPAELVLLHVAPADPEWVGWAPGPQSVRDQMAAELRRAHRATQRLADELRQRGSTRVRALTVQGPAPETILARAESLDAQILVLGAHHRGFFRGLFVGSVARSVLRGTRRPVLIVPERRAAAR